MSSEQDEDSGGGIDLETMRGRDWPSVRQFNVFVANRLGGLADVVRRFETTNNHIVSLTVRRFRRLCHHSVGAERSGTSQGDLRAGELPVTESDLLVVKLPEDAAAVADLQSAAGGSS